MKKNKHQKLQIIGLMSGTSLDGLDIAHCCFDFSGERVNFELIHSETVSYPFELESLLRMATTLKSDELFILDKQLGRFFGEQVVKFIQTYEIKRSEIDAIASHGHTIFHQPEKGFTLQIGCGTALSVTTGIPVINDFRTKDVLFGGQGAPLVPIGDFDLFFNEADAFLNLGGFSNISLMKDGNICAFDICPCNLPLNHFAQMLGLSYDHEGQKAKTGKINERLLQEWNLLPFYRQSAPKSLGTEWLEENFLPLINSSLRVEDSLRTCVEHIAVQIANQLNFFQINKVFLSGGGAKNDFLISQIKKHTECELIIPNDSIIDFKEAIIFSYLGALFLQDKPNNVPSVTGARASVIGGVLHFPN